MTNSNSLQVLTLSHFETRSGYQIANLKLTYQLFGKEKGTAPVVLVNHALTGNSDLASDQKGWWKSIIGPGKLLDTNRYTIIGFNIPGNGYDGQLIENYRDFTAFDIAQIFIRGLEQLGVSKLYAAIGGSLGGGIAWEMAILEPELIQYLIPVASDWKSSDWIIGHNYIQDKLLQNSQRPLEDARMMAMLFYRTPQSFKAKFQRTRTADDSEFNVNSWLQHHGDKLQSRFKKEAYQLMNHLLTTVDITANKSSFEQTISPVKSTIIQIAVNSDLFFTAEENKLTNEELNRIGKKNEFFMINSIHGHDAFLIEFKQLTQILTPFFKN